MKRINVILYEPEIAENCGNIIRSCVGFNAKLHLIFPLGFNLYDKRVKRSCVNYFDNLDYETYDDYNDFCKKHPNAKIYYLTRYGHKSPSEIKISKEDEEVYFMFGKESTGIPYDILHNNLNYCFDCYPCIPQEGMRKLVRLDNFFSYLFLRFYYKIEKIAVKT